MGCCQSSGAGSSKAPRRRAAPPSKGVSLQSPGSTKRSSRRRRRGGEAARDDGGSAGVDGEEDTPKLTGAERAMALASKVVVSKPKPPPGLPVEPESQPPHPEQGNQDAASPKKGASGPPRSAWAIMDTLKGLSSEDASVAASAHATWKAWTGVHVGQALLDDTPVKQGGTRKAPGAGTSTGTQADGVESTVATFMHDLGPKRVSSVLLEYVGKKSGADGEVKAHIIMVRRVGSVSAAFMGSPNRHVGVSQLLQRCWDQFEPYFGDKDCLRLLTVFCKRGECT